MIKECQHLISLDNRPLTSVRVLVFKLCSCYGPLVQWEWGRLCFGVHLEAKVLPSARAPAAWLIVCLLSLKDNSATCQTG